MDDNNDLWNLDRQDYVALVTELRAELAQARAERDRVYNDNERTRYDIWCLAEEYKNQWVRVDPKGVAEDILDLLHTSDRPPLIERQRRTIRALVVAARAMWWAIHRMASDEQCAYFRALAKTEAIFMLRFGVTSDREAGEAVTKIWNERAQQSGQQAGE